MGIRSELGRAGNDLIGTAKQSGREVWQSLKSKDVGEFAGEVLMEQPAKIGLNILGISMRTFLKISGLLAWRTAKLGLKGLAHIAFLPMAIDRERFNPTDYSRMAREAPVEIASPEGRVSRPPFAIPPTIPGGSPLQQAA